MRSVARALKGALLSSENTCTIQVPSEIAQYGILGTHSLAQPWTRGFILHVASSISAAVDREADIYRRASVDECFYFEDNSISEPFHIYNNLHIEFYNSNKRNMDLEYNPRPARRRSRFPRKVYPIEEIAATIGEQE